MLHCFLGMPALSSVKEAETAQKEAVKEVSGPGAPEAPAAKGTASKAAPGKGKKK